MELDKKTITDKIAQSETKQKIILHIAKNSEKKDDLKKNYNALISKSLGLSDSWVKVSCSRLESWGIIGRYEVRGVEVIYGLTDFGKELVKQIDDGSIKKSSEGKIISEGK
jgi:hypothetical protein